jgi:hypothetical protein
MDPDLNPATNGHSNQEVSAQRVVVSPACRLPRIANQVGEADAVEGVAEEGEAGEVGGDEGFEFGGAV